MRCLHGSVFLISDLHTSGVGFSIWAMNKGLVVISLVNGLLVVVRTSLVNTWVLWDYLVVFRI